MVACQDVQDSLLSGHSGLLPARIFRVVACQGIPGVGLPGHSGSNRVFVFFIVVVFSTVAARLFRLVVRVLEYLLPCCSG